MAGKEKKEGKKNIFTRAWGAVRRFFKEIFLELKKVTWPTKKEVVQNTVSVILFCLLVGVIIWASDFLLETVLSWVYSLGY